MMHLYQNYTVMTAVEGLVLKTTGAHTSKSLHSMAREPCISLKRRGGGSKSGLEIPVASVQIITVPRWPRQAQDTMYLVPRSLQDLASTYTSQHHPSNHHGPLSGPPRPHHLCAPLGLLRCCSFNLPFLTSFNFVSHHLASRSHLKCHSVRTSPLPPPTPWLLG